MENRTTEFSFILKPAKYGVGVFAVHDIKKDTYLRLFNEENVEVSISRERKDIPELFQEYCVDRGDMLLCPKDFGHMEVGWYINHSKDPNAYHKDYNYYALRDIKAGEEIIIDYNTLEEPEESKKEYYSK
ncbi:MAG: SET domain-containing protein [Candidatus Paceibacterota bacterium]|jgi:hypothetical protein